MERKKTITLTFLILIVFMFVCQAYTIGHSVATRETTQLENKRFDNLQPKPPTVAITFNWTDFNTSAQPKVWFYINIILVIAVPITFIVQTVVTPKLKPKNNPSGDEDIPEDESTEDVKVAQTIAPEQSIFVNLVRFGFLAIFIQNIAILVLYVAFLVTIPQSASNPDISLNILKIYSIVFYLDFLAALLAAVGLILLAPKTKSMIQCYIAGGFWIAWIGLGIWPRINTVMSIGLFGGTTGVDLSNWALNFYGSDLFLINAGSIALAVALFNTAMVLYDEGYLRGKGSLNSFGIGNYIVSSGFALILLIMLTFGNSFTDAALGSLGLLWLIFIIAKFLVAPVIGLISGIVGFRQLNPNKMKS